MMRVRVAGKVRGEVLARRDSRLDNDWEFVVGQACKLMGRMNEGNEVALDGMKMTHGEVRRMKPFGNDYSAS